VHEDLAVHAEMKQQADVGLGERSPFLVGEVVVGQTGVAINVVLGLPSFIAVQFEQEFLDEIQAHLCDLTARPRSSRSNPEAVGTVGS
jgi:hypothetical protein